MQGAITVFLCVIWGIAIRSGAPAVALIIAAVITFYFLLLVYTGYPARFDLTPDGITLGFTFGRQAFFKWSDVTKFRVTGPAGVIEVRRTNWASRLINKYVVMLLLLDDAKGFRQEVVKNLSPGK